MHTKTEGLTVKQLAAAAGLRLVHVNAWIKGGHFRPGAPAEKGITQTYTVEDAMVLRAMGRLLLNNNLNLPTARMHAEKIRGAKRDFDNHLIVATDPVARTLGIAADDFHHVPSNTYGLITDRESHIQNHIAVISLRDLEIEVEARIK